MNALFRSVRHNLRGLARFSGRDANILFWPWVAVLIAATTLAAAAATLTVLGDTLARMQRFAAAHPDQTEVVSTPTSYRLTIHGNHPELMPAFDPFFHAMAAITAALVLLLAASVTRRLHDTGRSGAWGLLPLPFLAFAFTAFPRVMDSFRAAQATQTQPAMGLFGLLFLNNALYMAALIALVLLLARRGTPGPNRYGEADTSGSTTA